MIYYNYPGICHIGHPLIADLFLDEVLIEEKVDGSQFNWGISPEGTPWYRSKGSELYPETADKLFQPAIAKINEVVSKLKPGLFYRGETLHKPKHNTLKYNRVPKGNIVLFDIDDGNGNFLGLEEKKTVAKELGLEAVPALRVTKVVDPLKVAEELLSIESVLGGTPVEGIVFKNYKRFGKDGKPLFGKLVSEKFREKHHTRWKNKNPGANGLIENLTNIYKHENRWLKAIQHLKERGDLKGVPEDIGRLMREILEDVKKEERDNIVNLLWEWAWPKISRGIVRGFPEFYKKYSIKTP